MKINKPCLIFASGVAGSGKSSILDNFAKHVDNAVRLDRDDLNRAYLHVKKLDNEGYGSKIRSYFDSEEDFFENLTFDVDTPFGVMDVFKPSNDFYKIHTRNQSYLALLNLAKTNLELGKVVVADCIVNRQIMDGTWGNISKLPLFEKYHLYLVHFFADEDILKKRILSRNDEYAKKREEYVKASNPDPKVFQEFINPLKPDELENYSHLLINTGVMSVKQCTKSLIDYITE